MELVVYATEMPTAGSGAGGFVLVSTVESMGGQWRGHSPEPREGRRVHTHTAI